MDIVRYSFEYIKELSSTLKITLQEETIRSLKQIKINSQFFKHTINLKYVISSDNWRGGDAMEEVFDDKAFRAGLVSNLNKLTHRNFDAIFIELHNGIKKAKEHDINIECLIEDLFEKAAEENMYSDLYSMVLGKLLEEDKDLEGLRILIQQRVKENYESISNINISEIESDMAYDMICEINKSKRLLLGSIVFISNLFNYKLVSYDYLLKYYNKLIDFTKTAESDKIGIYIETISAIVTTCGNSLRKYDSEAYNDNFVAIIKELSNDRERLTPKYRFKLKDVLDAIKE